MRAALGDIAGGRVDRAEQISAWVCFNTSAAISEHINTSSVTDNGAGDWTINWSVPFSNNAWAVVGSARNAVGVCVKQSVALTATSVNITTGNGVGTVVDPGGSGLIYIGGIGH